MVLAKHVSALDVFCKEQLQATFRSANWRSADTLARDASSLVRIRRFRHPRHRHHRTLLGLSRSLPPSPPLYYFGLQKRNVMLRKKLS